MVSFITQKPSKEYMGAVLKTELLYMDRTDFW